ncbi:hypothetical protein Tco_0305808, partial [Tanacetum coccineum]
PYVVYGELQYWCFPPLVDVMLSFFYLAEKMDTNGLCHISAWAFVSKQTGEADIISFSEMEYRLVVREPLSRSTIS